MKKIPEFKSEDEELEFWSKHSMLEFMDVGEEVRIDASEARKNRNERCRSSKICKDRCHLSTQTINTPP